MSELTKVESIMISLFVKCPHCGYLNSFTKSNFPTSQTIVNDEVQLFYIDICNSCKKEIRFGVNAIPE